MAGVAQRPPPPARVSPGAAPRGSARSPPRPGAWAIASPIPPEAPVIRAARSAIPFLPPLDDAASLPGARSAGGAGGTAPDGPPRGPRTENMPPMRAPPSCLGHRLPVPARERVAAPRRLRRRRRHHRPTGPSAETAQEPSRRRRRAPSRRPRAHAEGSDRTRPSNTGQQWMVNPEAKVFYAGANRYPFGIAEKLGSRQDRVGDRRRRSRDLLRRGASGEAGAKSKAATRA